MDVYINLDKDMAYNFAFTDVTPSICTPSKYLKESIAGIENE
jgi:hypothetical protein